MPLKKEGTQPPISERLAALPRKIRENGAGWLAKRVWREAFVPTTTATRTIRDVLARLQNRVRSRSGFHDDGLMPAFYDLDVNPITFDFSWFLIAAEMASRRAGKAGFKVVLVPSSANVLSDETRDYVESFDETSRRWRFDNVLVGLARLSPACRAVVICGSRKEAGRYVESAEVNFPPHYSTLFPRGFEYADLVAVADRPGCFVGLQAPEQGRRYVRAWIERHAPGRRLITATLRHYRYQPSRNSDLHSWAQFLQGLDTRLYAPVIVPDTDSAFEELPALSKFPIFSEAAWNMGLRMALYELAYANLFVNNGPASLAQLNPACNYLFTKIIVPDCPQATEGFLRERGLERGRSPQFATPTQLWWWHDDTVENLERGFHTLVERIEAKS